MNWKKEINEIKLRKKLAKKQGGREAVSLQHAKGRLTLRERIEKLADKDSFKEQGEIAGYSETDDKGKDVVKWRTISSKNIDPKDVIQKGPAKPLPPDVDPKSFLQPL